MKIVTHNIYPPIPIRTFDWTAYDDDRYCGCGECKNLVGYGATRDEALTDLCEQLAEEF